MGKLDCRDRALRFDEPGDRAKARAWSSDQMPLSLGEMRPSGETAVASTITRPAPPTARLPRCTMCQSVGRPLSLEYWHMGETKTRLEIVSSRSRSWEKRCSGMPQL